MAGRSLCRPAQRRHRAAARPEARRISSSGNSSQGTLHERDTSPVPWRASPLPPGPAGLDDGVGAGRARGARGGSPAPVVRAFPRKAAASIPAASSRGGPPLRDLPPAPANNHNSPRRSASHHSSTGRHTREYRRCHKRGLDHPPVLELLEGMDNWEPI